MAFTLEETKTEVRNLIGNRTKYDSRLNNLIHMAEVRIARLHTFDELFKVQQNVTTFTGDISVDKLLSIPINLRKILSFRLIDGTLSRKLIYKPFIVWDSLIPNPGSFRVDRPEFYTRWGDVVELWPVPDAEYSVIMRFILWPNKRTTDIVSDLEFKDDAIIYLTAAYCAHLIGRKNDANTYWRTYKEIINNIIGEEREKPDFIMAPDNFTTPSIGGSVSGDYWNNPFFRG